MRRPFPAPHPAAPIPAADLVGQGGWRFEPPGNAGKMIRANGHDAQQLAAWPWDRDATTRRTHTAGASPEEVATGWVRMAKERKAILDWARANFALMKIVQEYHFERRYGSSSSTASGQLGVFDGLAILIGSFPARP